jgi:hypothetical protein
VHFLVVSLVFSLARKEAACAALFVAYSLRRENENRRRRSSSSSLFPLPFCLTTYAANVCSCLPLRPLVTLRLLLALLSPSFELLIAPLPQFPSRTPRSPSIYPVPSQNGSAHQLQQVPMRVINRPLPSELDQDKVERFMEDIKVRREAYSRPYRASLTPGTVLKRAEGRRLHAD